VFIFAVLFLLACAGAALRINYARSDEEERRRALWVVEGALSWFWILIPLFVAERLLERRLEGTPWEQVILSVGFPFVALVMVCSLGFAVLYQGALDPRLAVQRTTLYGVLASVMVLGFAIAEGLIGDLVVSRLGLPVGSGAWIAGGLVAFTFQPLHGFLRRRMDHWSDERIPEPDLTHASRYDAVVVVSGIVGYPALEAESADDALTMASILRRAAKRGAEQEQGRLATAKGGGVLMEFTDATRALAASRHLTASFQKACEPLGLAHVQLRTGVHLGEVAKHEDGALSGDAVHIARGLEGEAEPGQIVVSQDVADQLVGVGLDGLGDRTLANVPDPVTCWAVSP
jgi:class 3 adenylate cyclase